MNTSIHIIITFLLIAHVLFGGHARLVNVGIRESSINLAVESDEDIYGIQFDLHYNNTQLVLTEDEIHSKVNGIKIYSSINETGIARILMFGMPGEKQKLFDSKIDTIANLIDIEFNPRDQFKGSSAVELFNITVAGKAGIEIDLSNESDYTFDISFLKPKSTLLVKNLPNPFNSTTTIYYQLSESCLVSLNIYDWNGLVIKNLVGEYQEVNYYTITWNGLDSSGHDVSSGHYILKMETPGFSDTINMTLLK